LVIEYSGYDVQPVYRISKKEGASQIYAESYIKAMAIGNANPNVAGPPNARIAPAAWQSQGANLCG